MKKLKGKYWQLRANGHTIGLSTSGSLQTTTQYSSDEKTKDEEKGPESGTAEWVDWSATVDALMGVSEASQLTYAQLMDLQLSLTELDLEFFIASNANVYVPEGDWTPDTATEWGAARLGGKVTIESISSNGPNEGNASFTVNFKAAGKLNKIAE